MAKKPFFNEIQGAAVLKHGILGRYLYTWASMVGSRNRLLYYLDGYAGPGTYTNGVPGSPTLAAETAAKLAKIRDLRGICVEPEGPLFHRLDQQLGGYPGWRAVHGRIENCLPDLLREIGTAPLFAFFDPFGVGLPFHNVVKVMRRSAGPSWRVKTEVLLNFSIKGLQRNAGGQLTSQTEASSKTTMLTKADAWLGGPWWTYIWHAAVMNRERDIARGYANRLSDAAGGDWRVYMAPISDTWEGAPAYWLILLSKSVEGPWKFNDALSLAREKDFRAFCGRGEELRLYSEVDEWKEEIERNVDRLGRSLGTFVPGEVIGDLYGEALGKARETHVRQVLVDLHKRGLTEPDPKGEKKIVSMTVRWIGG